MKVPAPGRQPRLVLPRLVLPRLVLPRLVALAATVSCLFVVGCKGGDSAPPDGLGGESGDGDGDGDAVPAACTKNSECNDSLFCNGQEVCADGFCRQGTPPACSDGIRCTIDACDETLDECVSVPPDADGDGHADSECLDADGTPFGEDCDDNDPLAFPGNAEVCDPDDRDEDCDPTTIGERDADGDGYLDAACCNEQADGELLCGEDCDDRRANVNPQATEACDFLDNNCDGEVDEGVFVNMYPDADHDGHGDESADEARTCPQAVGFASSQDDCDDDDPEVFKGQFEICDGKDNNCNGDVDEVEQQAPWYKDADGDGYGDPESTPTFSCYRVPGRVLSQNDCDDSQKTINPNATEICDGLDNDCDGEANAPVGINDFEDDDRDGVPDEACGGTDCDDTDPRTSEGAVEVCDHVDNDCDGKVDEETVQNIWYLDEDGDGWGVVLGSALASCDPIVGRAINFGDCDDTDRDVYPGRTEYCDGVDEDCDGQIDEGSAVHCKRDNAVTSCGHGACSIYSCVPGFADENAETADGCEAEAALPEPLGPCSTNSECNNGNLCDGFEACIGGQCYPGTAINCGASATVIEGDVQIQTGQDLQALKSIQMVTGDVFIVGTNLVNLIGLESLQVIGGDLQIRNNNLLKRLSGSALSGLQTVGGDVVIENNLALTDVDLPALLAVTSLQIIANPALEVVGSYSNLSKVDQQIYVADNPALTEISGFEALGRVGGGYLPAERGSTCRRHFDNGDVPETGGGIVIVDNWALSRLDAFANVTDVPGDLCVRSFVGEELELPGLKTVGMSVQLEYLLAVSELILPRLENVGLDLLVTHTEPEVSDAPFPVLEAILLPELEAVGGRFELFAHAGALKRVEVPELEGAEVLSLNLYEMSGAFSQLDLAELTHVGALEVSMTGTTGASNFILPALAQVTNDATFDFQLADAQESISFPELQTAGGAFRLYTYNETPLDVVSLPELTSVGALDVSTNTADLELGNLTTVGTDPELASFTLCTLTYADLCTVLLPFEQAGYLPNSCGECN